MPQISLEKPSELFRSTVARGLEKTSELPRIDREGGKYGAGIIRGASIIARGEALGHGMWIDQTMLGQVAEAIERSGGHGIRSRFAHPSLSGDGIGKAYGKVFSARVDGDRVFADIHMLESGHDTPDGDLAGYVMDLADEAPDAFGVSIAFRHDVEQFRDFHLEHGAKWKEGEDGPYLDFSEFRSPDPLNQQNLPHARLKSLRAADVVDSPAANPSGLFHAETFDLLAGGEQLLDFCFGLSGQCPDTTSLGIDATRLKGFAARWADQRGLSLKKEIDMAEATATETKPAEQPAIPPADRGALLTEFRAGLTGFIEQFGAENGSKWFAEGITLEQAKDRHIAALQTGIKERDAKLAAAADGLGEREALSGSGEEGQAAPGKEFQKYASPGIAGYAASIADKLPSRN